MMNPSFDRIWKRPHDVAPFPNIWVRVSVKSRSGHTYKIRIQDVTPDQHDEVWDMFVKYFYPDEELVRSAKQLGDKITMQSQKLCFHQCLKENLSIIAVLDNEDPKPTMLGALVFEVVSKDDPSFPTLPGEARGKVQNLFRMLKDGIDEFKKLKIDKYFTDYGIVVNSEYRRLGIGRLLFETMGQMAKTFNIPAAIVIVNNHKSQALVAKLGYLVLREVKLSNYVDENGHMIIPVVDTKVVQLCYCRFL